MPFKDAERRNAYRRKRYAERREQDRDERNRRDREGRAAKRRAEREAVPDPERRDPWPHQRDLYDVLESSDPPRLLTVCKAARVGSTTVQLLPADAAARRGGSVGVYAPTMTMAREWRALRDAHSRPRETGGQGTVSNGHGLTPGVAVHHRN